MKNIFDHIEHLQGKPHHIRRKVALGIAALGSALIAFVWLAGNLATGAFAIAGSSFAMSNEQNVVATTSDSGNQGLAGVAAAAAFTDTNAPAHILIVDTKTTSLKKQPEQTTLPF